MLKKDAELEQLCAVHEERRKWEAIEVGGNRRGIELAAICDSEETGES